ncbi:ribosome biogenesis erb1 isoform X2 [Olea europaea subsp. europaea]|uniref:Ribosome biogenesis erb1 isoform X2 n=1 Tax=Olea europaea subsp. europaea TaxID=158383 RepID=A0A8S0VAT4_OLEEU|nr:ribosome biogenesis erb1 isoform X2 [Olea europaea subsp. europaea]
MRKLKISWRTLASQCHQLNRKLCSNPFFSLVIFSSHMCHCISKHFFSFLQEEAVKKKYGGIMPKKPPLISKDHERAYFDSADWALGKQGVEKPKGPLEALRPKLQPTQQQTRYRKSPCAPAEGEDGNAAPPEDEAAKE